MKCVNYDPDEFGCMSPFVVGKCPMQYGRHPEITVNVWKCRHGWIQFWSPAERAGIRAMGKELKSSKQWIRDAPEDQKQAAAGGFMEAIFLIKTYVQAARKAKEEK